jgi:hypothetical protein
MCFPRCLPMCVRATHLAILSKIFNPRQGHVPQLGEGRHDAIGQTSQTMSWNPPARRQAVFIGVRNL